MKVFDNEGNVNPEFLEIKDASLLKPKVTMPGRLKREVEGEDPQGLISRDYVQRKILAGFRDDTQQGKSQGLLGYGLFELTK